MDSRVCKIPALKSSFHPPTANTPLLFTHQDTNSTLPHTGTNYAIHPTHAILYIPSPTVYFKHNEIKRLFDTFYSCDVMACQSKKITKSLSKVLWFSYRHVIILSSSATGLTFFRSLPSIHKPWTCFRQYSAVCWSFLDRSENENGNLKCWNPVLLSMEHQPSSVHQN